MGAVTDVAQKVYAAFGRGDLAAIEGLVADTVDWEFIGRAWPSLGMNRPIRPQASPRRAGCRVRRESAAEHRPTAGAMHRSRIAFSHPVFGARPGGLNREVQFP